MFLLAQILRMLSAVFEILADGCSNKKLIFLLNGIYNLLAASSYFLLNAFTGGLGCLLAIVRNIIFYVNKDKTPLWVLITYLVFIISIGLISDFSLLGVMPCILVGIYTIGLYTGDVKIIKISVIITCILEIIYDYIVMAYAGIVVCSIDIVVVIISMILDKKKKELKKGKTMVLKI